MIVQNSFPIRSHIENNDVSNGHTKPVEIVSAATIQNNAATNLSDANVYKDLGNNCVKTNDYECAVKHYTKAIEMKEEAVFYSNRAFCYLKLEQ